MKKNKEAIVDKNVVEDDPRFQRFQTILKDFRIIFRASQAHARWVEKVISLTFQHSFFLYSA